MDFFENMSTIQITYWIVAITGTSIFVLLFILGLFGADTDADVDTDVETDAGIGLQFFTFKNVMAFFTIFGWTGISCIDSGYSTSTTIIFSVLAGLATMVAMASLFLWINKLAENGTLQITNAIGQVGEVYLSIGSNRSKMGKISIDVQGSKRELNALTDHEENLNQGDMIKVIEVVSGEIVLVEKLTK